MKLPLPSVLVVSSLVLCSCGREEVDVAAAEQQLAALVPQDAVAFVRLASLDTLNGRCQRLAAAFGEDPDPVEIDDLLRMLGGRVGGLVWIDRTLPIGLALSIPGGLQPAPVIFVPTIDAAAYVASLPTGRGIPEPVADGRYVAVPLVARYRKPTALAKLAQDLPRGDLALRADVARTVAMLRGLIDVGLDQAERELPAALALTDGGFDAGKLVGVYLDILRAMLESIEVLELTVDLRGGVLDVQVRLDVAEDSPMDGWSSDRVVDVAELAGFLTGAHHVEFVAAGDFAKLAPRITAPWKDVFAGLPDSSRNFVLPMLENAELLQSSFGDAMATTLNFGGESGFQVKVHMRGDDSTRIVSTCDAIAASQPFADFGLVIGAPQLSDAADTLVRDYEAALDSEKFAAAIGVEYTPEDREEATRAMTRLWGGEGRIRVRLAARTDRAVLALGGDDAYRAAALADLDPPPAAPDPDLQSILDRVADLNPFVVERINLGRYLAYVTRSLGELLPHLTMLNEIEAVDTYLTVFGGIKAREWRVGFTLDVVGLADLTRQMIGR